MGGQAGTDVGDLVTRTINLPDRYRHASHQGLLGQCMVVFQIGADGAAANCQHHIVHRGAGDFTQLLQLRQGKTGGAKFSRPRHRHIEAGSGRREGCRRIVRLQAHGLHSMAHQQLAQVNSHLCLTQQALAQS